MKVSEELALIPGLTRLDSPIDVMCLIHKALRLKAARVEELVRCFKVGDSLQPIRGAFNFWGGSSDLPRRPGRLVHDCYHA